MTEETESVEVTSRPENASQLADLIESLTVFDYADGGDGYEKSADAMWKAAEAAFDYTARKVGATGFQASWAALKFYGEVMNVKGPFMVVKVEEALYPQYDILSKLKNYMDEQREWLREQAKLKIAEYEENGRDAHPNVLAHWKRLAGADS